MGIFKTGKYHEWRSHRGDLIILASPSSMGLAAITMRIAGHIAIMNKRPVAIFSLTTDRESLISLLLCSMMGTDNITYLSKMTWGNLVKCCAALYESPIYIYDTPMLEISQMKDILSRLTGQGDLGLVVVDNIELIYEKTIEHQLGGILAELINIAQELQVPIIALNQ